MFSDVSFMYKIDERQEFFLWLEQPFWHSVMNLRFAFGHPLPFCCLWASVLQWLFCFFVLYNHIDFFPFLPPLKNLDFWWDSRIKEAVASHSAWKVMWCQVGQCGKKLIIMSRWLFQGALFQVYRSIGDSVQYAMISWICEKWEITLQIHSLILLRFWCMCFMSMWRLWRVGSKFLVVLHLSISSGCVVWKWVLCLWMVLLWKAHVQSSRRTNSLAATFWNHGKQSIDLECYLLHAMFKSWNILGFWLNTGCNTVVKCLNRVELLWSFCLELGAFFTCCLCFLTYPIHWLSVSESS